jgi:hypothetical protein
VTGEMVTVTDPEKSKVEGVFHVKVSMVKFWLVKTSTWNLD